MCGSSSTAPPTPAVDLPFAGYFDRQQRAVHLSRAGLQDPQRGVPGRLQLLCPHPLPEVLQDRGRPGLGRLLPLQLHAVSRRERRCPPSRATLPPRTRRRWQEVNDFLATAAGNRPGRDTRGREGAEAIARAAGGRDRRHRRPRRPGRHHGLKVRLPSHGPRGADARRCASWRCASTGTARRARPCGAPWATSSARPPGVNPYKSLPMGMTAGRVLLILVHAVRLRREGGDRQRRRHDAGRWICRVVHAPLRQPAARSGASTPSGTATRCRRPSRSARSTGRS